MLTDTVKILVVEDDKFLLKVIQAKLQKSGFEVIVAMDGEEALKQAFGSAPALILLDLILPKKNGFDVLVSLRADPRTRSIPVIIASNLGQDTDVKKGMQLGADDYIVKSNISISDILSKVQQHLQ